MMPDAIDDLLKAERGRKGFSTQQRAGMWDGIASAIGPLPGSAPDDKAPEASPPSPPASPSAAAPPLAPAAGVAGWKVGALAALAAIGGAGVGAMAHARWAEPKVVVRTVEVAGATAPAAIAASVAAPVAPPPPPPLVSAATVRAVPPMRASAATSGPPSPRDPGLARERTLLDMARTALSRGDSTAALSAADTHTREFPQSQLAEEREVLAIQALASANRSPEARRRAAVFRMTYPKSALLPIVDEAAR